MRTVSLNLCRDMHLDPRKPGFEGRLRRRVADDILRAVAESGATVAGWQECETPVHHEELDRLAGWLTEHFGGAASALPISWRDDLWEPVSSGRERVHRGLARVTPSRWVTWVVLRHRATGRLEARVNGHAVSGAWSKGLRPTTALRRRWWRLYMRRLSRRMLLLAAAPGVEAVVGGGDMNNPRGIHRLPLDGRIAMDVRPAVPTHGSRRYDWLFHVEAPGLARDRGQVIRGLWSDHEAVAASVG